MRGRDEAGLEAGKVLLHAVSHSHILVTKPHYSCTVHALACLFGGFFYPRFPLLLECLHTRLERGNPRVGIFSVMLADRGGEGGRGGSPAERKKGMGQDGSTRGDKRGT